MIDPAAPPPELPRWLPRGLAERIAARPLVAAIAQNALWLVLERLVGMAVGFFITAWFVRHLGPEEFGRYSYALSFAALFAVFATLGTDSVIVRELSRDRDAQGEILGTVLVLRLLAGVSAWTLGAIAVRFFRADGSTRALVVIAGASAVFIAAGVFELWFQARVAARGVVLARSGVNLLVHGLRASLILLSARTAAFVALIPLNGALVAAATFALFRRSRPEAVRLRWSAARARTIARASAPMLVTAVGMVVYGRVDQVMLATLCGDLENGIYAPAAALSELFAFVPLALSTSSFPVLVRAMDTLPPAEYEARLRSFYDAMAATGYAFALSLMLLAEPLVALLYGPAYARTAAVLQVHAASFLFTTMGVARGRYLIARNHLGFFVVTALLGAAVNVGLNLALLPRLGAMGAAWSTLVSYAVTNYLSGFLWRPLWHQSALLTASLALPGRLLARGASGALAAVRRA